MATVGVIAAVNVAGIGLGSRIFSQAWRLHLALQDLRRLIMRVQSVRICAAVHQSQPDHQQVERHFFHKQDFTSVVSQSTYPYQ